MDFAMLLALTTLALVSQIWTIDDNGPADFADLPAAVAAASDGDILQLMTGFYTGTTITKDLTLIGYASGFFETVTIGAPGLIVDGSGGGATSITVFALGVNDLTLRDLPGRVRLDSTRIGGMEVEGCADVVLTRSGLSSGGVLPGSLTVTDSTVHLVNAGALGGRDPVSQDGKAALALFGQSNVNLAGSTLVGGNAGSGLLLNPIPGPAIRVFDGSANVTVRGSSNNEIRGGYDPHSPLDPALTQAPSVEILGGTLNLEWSGITFADAPSPATTPTEPYLAVGPNPPNPLGPDLHRELTVYGAPNEVAFVVATAGSNTDFPTAYLGANLRVNLGSTFVLQALTLQGQDVPATAMVIPPTDPSFVGFEIDVQALVGLSSGASYLTNASHIVLK